MEMHKPLSYAKAGVDLAIAVATTRTEQSATPKQLVGSGSPAVL
jgi:hypothetical protein